MTPLDLSCPVCGAKPAEPWTEVERARADERAAIVAWLRAEAMRPFEGAIALFWGAQKIETGAHLKGEER
jgi:hypothetical protein